MDDLRRARAILGMPQNATPEQFRTRYRELVKQWHPDRYASDPQGQIEAEARMREINVAFDLLLAASGAPHVEPPRTDSTASAARPPAPGQRLTREQIDRLVGSIGTAGPLDWLFERKTWDHPLNPWRWLIYLVLLTAILAFGRKGREPVGELRGFLLILCVAFVLVDVIGRAFLRLKKKLERFQDPR